MIGRDYYSWGSKRHISHRYGDNQGNPYMGPIKFSLIDRKRILVHARNQILHVQNLDHAIEAQVHPTLRTKAPPKNKRKGLKETFVPRAPPAATEVVSPPLAQPVEGTAEKVDPVPAEAVVLPPSQQEPLSAEAQLLQAANDEEMKRKEEEEAKKKKEEDEEDDWEAKVLMMETNEIAQSKFPIRHTTIEGMTLASTSIYNESMAVIVDDRCRIKLFDWKTMDVVKSFGESGDQAGGIVRPTAVACAAVGPHTKLILVGDCSEGQVQRISCFSSHGDFVVDFGSEGPMLGQFRDISCIAIRPFTCDKGIDVCQQLERQRKVAILRGKNPREIGLPSPPLPTTVQSPPSYPEDDFYRHPYIPSWYQPTMSMEELEDTLFNDELPNNFVVGRRAYDANIFDILFVSTEKKIVRIQAKYQSQQDIDHILREGNTILTDEEKKPGFFIANRMGEKVVYASLHELLRKNPYVKDLRIREESRDYLVFAVVDRRNYRVQLLRLFWTRSLLFTPTIEVVDVIGGSKCMHCELLDPVAVAYAPTGDLAVCDGGRNGILILSPSYHLVKFIQLTFESMRDIKEAGAIAQRERERKRAEEQAVIKRKQMAAQQKTRRVHEEKQLHEDRFVKEKYDSETIASLTTFASTAPSLSLASSTASAMGTTTAASTASRTVGGSRRGPRPGGGGGSSVTGSVVSYVAEKESVAKKKPSWVEFGEDGSMIVGFHTGGLYIFKPNVSLPVGKLEKLEFTILNKIIIDYLTYDDVVQLRNCCRFLHDFTRELRLNFRIFPRERRPLLNKVLHLFTRWARLNPDGSDNLKDRVFLDALHRPICPYHMKLQCHLPASKCPDSHGEVVYDRTDLQQTGAYLIYDDFLFMVSELFGPTFVYQFEVYLQALFQAFSKTQLVFMMHDGMSRANETLRERHPVPEVHVVYFHDVLELILVLEEQYSGCKEIQQHKLFATGGKSRRRNLPEIATSFETLPNKTAYTDVLAQYHRGIEVSPVKHNLGRRIITRPGYEGKALPVHDPITPQEHISLVQRHTERAVGLMSRLFH